MELNKEEILRLIQEYKKHKLLWDRRDKWYFNKTKKKEAWDEIADAMNIDAEAAKRKFSSLLGSFRRERSKGKKALESGKHIYKSDWFAFKSLAFLLDKDKPKESIKSEQTNDDNSRHAYEDCDQTTNSNSEDENSLEIPLSVDSKVEKKKIKKSLKDKHSRIEKSNHFSQSIEYEDATTKYANYLAEKLKQFDPRTKAILIHKINVLLFETEMSTYSNAAATCSSPPTVDKSVL